jgi:hypothetical protein
VRRFALILIACLVAALLVPAMGSAGIKQRFFHTLDGNISCAMIKDTKTRRKHHKKIKGFPGEVRGDTVANPSAPALGPGASITLGRYTCGVLTASVRCTNYVNGHGFEVSAATVSLF